MITPFLYRLISSLFLAIAIAMASPAVAGQDEVAAPVLGECLSLVDAMRLATQHQPILQSLNDAAAAARESAVREGQLADPRLRLGVANLPVTSGDAWRFNRDEMTMATIGLSQEVMPQPKREANANVLEAEAGQYQMEQLATARAIQLEVAMAWLEVYEAQHQSGLYQRVVNDMAAERDVLASRIRSGAARTSEVLILDRQLSMAKDQHLRAKGDERRARAKLVRWIGNDAMRPVSEEMLPVAPVPDTTHAVENHPILQNARQIEAVAMSELERAKAERLQNWSWEVSYGRRFNDLSDMLTFQVAIDLQTDRANRQDRRAAEKLLLAEKARKLTDDKRQELTARLEAARADWETAWAREKEHQERLLPATDMRLHLAQAGYAAGTQPLSEVWEARRAVLEAQIEHWTIMTALQRAMVQVGYLLNDHRFFPGGAS